MLEFKSVNVLNLTLLNEKSISSKNAASGVEEFLADGREFDAAYPLSSSKYTFVTSDVILSYFRETLLLTALFSFFLKFEFVLTSFKVVPLNPPSGKPAIFTIVSLKISSTNGWVSFADG